MHMFVTFVSCVYLLRAKEEFFNSTLRALSIKPGINATRSEQEFNLTFYLSIYAGKPSILLFTTTCSKYQVLSQSVDLMSSCRFRADSSCLGVRLRKEFSDHSQPGESSSESAQQHVQRCHPHACPLLWRQPHRWALCQSHWHVWVEQRPLAKIVLLFLGRVLNRFSKDIGLLDSTLPITFVDFYQVRTSDSIMKTEVNPWPNSSAVEIGSSDWAAFCFVVVLAEHRRGCRGGLSHPSYPRPRRPAGFYLLVLEAFLPPYITRCQTPWIYKYVAILLMRMKGWGMWDLRVCTFKYQIELITSAIRK